MLRSLVLLVALFFVQSAQPSVPGVLMLDKGSFVKLAEDVNVGSASKFIKAFLSLPEDTVQVTVFVDSPGGEVLAGLRMVETVRAAKAARPGLHVTCFIQSAASMAFFFVQLACDERIVGPTAIVMQHQASIGMAGKWGEVQSRVNLISQVVNWLEKETAARLGVSLKRYRELVVNDWWLVGQAAVDAGAADRVGQVLCSSELTAANECPLVLVSP